MTLQLYGYKGRQRYGQLRSAVAGSQIWSMAKPAPYALTSVAQDRKRKLKAPKTGPAQGPCEKPSKCRKGKNKKGMEFY